MKISPSNIINSMLNRLLRPVLARLSNLDEQIQKGERQNDKNSFLIADHLIKNHISDQSLKFGESEFSVFSQWGQDGIIQYLIKRVPIENHTFIEFGVEDYSESNTRFLMMHDNWSGLVMDGKESNINSIKSREYYWRHDLTAQCAFITRENINELIGRRFRGDIGILSIDIDGNDYWVWEAIEVVRPRIVICEYNSLFGVKRSVTIPYSPQFSRTSAHHSNLYYGASLPALHRLALQKDYVFAGCTKSGGDAFFVRKDVSQNITVSSLEEGYVYSKVREARNPDGQLSFDSGEDRLRLIANLEVFDTEQQKPILLFEL